MSGIFGTDALFVFQVITFFGEVVQSGWLSAFFPPTRRSSKAGALFQHPEIPDCAGFCNKRMISSSPKAGLVKVTTLQRVRVKNMLAVFFYDIDQLKIICLKRSEV